VKPDIAFALDVGMAYDIPGFEGHPGEAAMGEGPLMFIMDYTMIPHTGLRNLVMDTAEELEIPLQVDALMGGGTDGAKFHLHGTGCPTVVIGFPTRYVHSHNSLMSRHDFEQAARLLTAVIKKLDQNTLDSWL
jgi:putative aminopeptidase FrvX